MTRRTEIRFGRFDRTISTAVHANGWWLLVANRVELLGDTVVWLDLARYLPISAEIERVAAPARPDAEWAGRCDAFGVLPSACLDLVATCVETSADDDVVEVAVPFLLRERNGRSVLGFSELGPPAAVRDSIAVAVGIRLLRGAPP